MAVLLWAVGGPPQPIDPIDGRVFTVAELQQFVHGHFTARALSDGRLMIMNEDAAGLIENHAATAILRESLAFLDVVIGGDVLIVTRAEMGEPDAAVEDRDGGAPGVHIFADDDDHQGGGYWFVLGECYTCRNLFTFSPTRVPSVVVGGVRHAVCRTCVDRANPRRIANGLDPIVPLPGAYEPTPEFPE